MLQNNKDGKILPIMHGENFLVPINALPEGEIKSAKMYIVGHSETGHHHVLESPVEMDIIEGKHRAILVREVSTLFHKKSFDIHESVAVEPGIYQVTHKTEYDPFQKVIRAVFD